MKKLVKFSNGDTTGVDEKRLTMLVKTESVNLLVAEYIEPTYDADGNEHKVVAVEVDGKPWPPAKHPSPKSDKE